MEPATALVVDDNIANLAAAHAVGAFTVLVGAVPAPAPAEHRVIPSLAALPGLIDRAFAP